MVFSIEKTFVRVCDTLSEAGLDTSNSTMNTPLSEFGMDSLERASLILDLELDLNIEIPDEVQPRLITLGDVVEYVRSCQND